MEPIYSFDPQRFCLGTLCVYGHAWPGTTQSLKRISNVGSNIRKDFRRPDGIQVGNCIGCSGRKQSDWLLSFIDYEAMGWPTNQTLGKLCKKEHKWEGQNASLRRWRKCVECEKLRKIEQSQRKQRKSGRRWHPELRGLSPTERRKFYKRKLVQELRAQGLTSKGTVPTRADAGVARGERNEAMALERAFERALRTTRRSPSVARLVMNEQRRYWRENPEANSEHKRQWSQASWWLDYQTKPELRLYTRQKSKRRKALERGSVGIQVKGCQIAKRFAEFSHCCAYCGATGDLHIEHVIPISKGGTHVLSNVVPACQPCNYSKRAKDAETWYRAQPFFCKKRWAKILKVMGAGKGSPQQLALL
jgi:5-methylcytosine-specific restriction endonuclease McrA